MTEDLDRTTTAAPATPAGRSELRLRVLSALVMGPLVLALTWWGGVPFSLLLIACAVVMADEWSTIVLPAADTTDRLPGLGLVALAVAAGAFGSALRLSPGTVVFVVIVAIALAAALAMRTARVSAAGPTAVSWAPWGIFYAVVPCLALDTLRASPLGLGLIVFLFAVVWSTDIAAYFTGRAIGGPKLWPAVSPKKTWSGALGGLVGAVLAGLIVAHFAGSARLAPVAAVAAALSVVSQAGDLLESHLKRRFGVKDSGRIIPGHGGILDRVDGLVAAATLAVMIGLLHRGPLGGSSGLLLW